MRFVIALCLSLVGDGPAPAPVENVSTFPPRSAAEERRALHVPEGFEVQLVATEPDIQKPMNLAFDDRGRLWVTGSVEYPFPPKPGTRPRDAVKILEDFGPDGRARKITTFADGLNIPIGIIPLPGGNSCLVYSIPSIDRLTDDDGDGHADRCETVYRTFESRDTHGMTNSFSWGFDGWIYACHGFSNTSKVQGEDKVPIAMNSGNVYRIRADGTHAEYFTHGQVNPFGLSFDPLGNLYSSDCHTKPVYHLLRGAYYPSFGKPDDGLGFGPEMIRHDHGSTAIDGATYYAADQFPATYRDTVFIGNVVTNRINHDRLEWHGSSPRAIEQPDFVWSEDNWFRPVDTELGPDGALYVADFYNRIIGHYEVPLSHPGRDHDHGRIWRIVYRGPEGDAKAVTPRADWTKTTLDELIRDLGHPNLVVRTRAANEFIRRGPLDGNVELKKMLLASTLPLQRVHGYWVLERRGALDEPTLDRALSDPAREVRVHAYRILAERRVLSGSLIERARRGLTDADPTAQRAAAEALGLHPDLDNIRPLLALRQGASSEDTHLIHVVRMALRNQLGVSWGRLEDLGLNERDLRDIADVATGVPSAASADFLLHHLERFAASDGELARFAHHVARHGDTATVEALGRFAAQRSADAPVRMAGLLKAMLQGAQERGHAPSPLVRGLAVDVARRALASREGEEVLAGIGLAGPFQLRELRGPLAELAEGSTVPEPQRIEALAALAGMGPRAMLWLLDAIVCDRSAPIALRERAVSTLAAIDQPEARAALLEALSSAPDRLQTMLAFGLAARRPGAAALVEAVEDGRASARLLQAPVVAGPLANWKILGMDARVARLLKGLPPADKRLKDLLDRRRSGFAAARRDPAAGASVFEKTCAACHQIGGKGARIGPQLDGVGARGIDRLLEDILDPSRNVDQAFRITNLALTDGRVVSGLLLREEGVLLVLADPQGKEVRIPKEMVEEQSTAQVSPMPANFSEQIPENELYDLLSYLLDQKPSARNRK